MRFFAALIDPQTGLESLGSTGKVFGEYKNKHNFIKFGLRNAAPGQYNVYQWPSGTFTIKPLGVAYRRV